jgi:hypothetical protein
MSATIKTTRDITPNEVLLAVIKSINEKKPETSGLVPLLHVNTELSGENDTYIQLDYIIGEKNVVFKMGAQDVARELSRIFAMQVLPITHDIGNQYQACLRLRGFKARTFETI